MKKFTFNLEALLRVRRNREDLAQKEYIAAKMLYDQQMEKVNELKSERFKIEEEVRVKQMDRSDVREITNLFDYLQILKKKTEAQEDEAMKLLNASEVKRKEVLKAVQDRKLIEKLKEKKLAEWKKKADDLEKNFVDELATLRYLGNKGKSDSC